MPKITSPIVAYLQENIALHRRLNAGLRLAQDENDALTQGFKEHFAHPYHTHTQALLAHGKYTASLHDGYIKEVTERRIPGTNTVRTVIRASAYFYDTEQGIEVGRGEVVFTFTGSERFRKRISVQGWRIVEVVLDEVSGHIGLTLAPSFASGGTVVEHAFDLVAVRTVFKGDLA